MSIALAADVAWWQIALAVVGMVGAFAGAFIVAFVIVDLLRPRVRSMIASAAGVEARLLETTSADEYRGRGRRRVARGGVLAAVSFGLLWASVLLSSLD